MSSESKRGGGKRGFATRAIHAGTGERGVNGPVVPSIEQSATFRIPSVAAGAELMRRDAPGSVYGRLGNPTVELLERALADLEGGAGALVTGSGMAAASTIAFGLLEPGGRLVCARTIYGGVRDLFVSDVARFGVRVEFVDATDQGALREGLAEGASMLWLETPANPNLDLIDLETCAAAARAHGAITVVDNTFSSPLLQRPLELGIDVVMHSLSKAVNGHSDVIAGAIVTGSAELYERLLGARTRLGGVADPHQAWLVLRGLRTLPLRMRAAQENADRLARRLEAHDGVARVRYPGLESHPRHELCAKQMSGGGAMIAVELAGGRDAAVTFVESLELATLAGSLGGLETLAMHPASMSHVHLTEAELFEADIPPGLVRLAVGCESYEDLEQDVERALERAAASRPA